MKKCKRVLAFVLILCCSSMNLFAQFTTPTIDANFDGTGSYPNSYVSGSSTWYMTWNNTDLFVFLQNANEQEPVTIYLDVDPVLPVNGGTNSNGTLVGLNYDNYTTRPNLPFRADICIYAHNNYRELFRRDGANGWTSLGGGTSGIRGDGTSDYTSGNANGQYASNNNGNGAGSDDRREFRISWARLLGTINGGLRPASFNWMGYVAYNNGMYAQVPVENYNGSNVTGNSNGIVRYFTVSNTGDGTSTNPFGRNSYTHPISATNNSFGGISVYDFTMNSPSQQIARLNTGGDWNIGGTLVVNAGTVYFGSGGSGYGNTTVANVEVLGGTLNMDQTNKAMLVTGNVTINSGGTLALSGTSGGDLKLQGNWTRNGTGILTLNSRAVLFQGANNQTLTGTTTFDYLNMGKSAGNLTIASGNIHVNILLAFSDASNGGNANGGKIITGSNLVVFNGAGSASGSSTTSFIQGNAAKFITSGSSNPSFNFPVGDATGFGPVTLTGSGTTTAQGNLAVSTTAGDLNTPAGSQINLSNRLHRYWTVANNGITGLNSFAASFTYPSGEVGGVPANYVVRYTDGSSWYNASVSGVPGNTNTTTTQSINGAASIASSGISNQFVIGELNTYTLSYNGNGSNGGTAPASVTQNYNTTTTVAGAGSLTRTGYTFSGWNTAANGSGTAYAAGATFTFTSDVTLYAQWSINPYTLTYDGNGNDAGTAPVSVTQNYNTTTTVAGAGSLTRTGYTFSGWNTAANGSGTAYAAGATFTFTSDVTLYAQWSINPYTLTYDGNGNDAGTAPVSVTQNYNTTTTVAGAGSLTRTGYTFSGWNTAANGSGTAYAAGVTFTFTSDVTLYAQWSINPYTLTYDGNGNDAGTAPVSVTQNYNTTTTVAGAGSLTRTGYTFSGWNTAANGSGTAYAAGATFTFTSDVTLYAQWSINPYTLTYDGNGNDAGTAPVSVTQNYNTTTTVAGAGSLTRTGYTFSGWNTAANGSGTAYAAGATFTFTSDVTLYAQWSINPYTLTYDGNGNDAGTAPVSVTQNYNTTTTVAGAGSLTRTGYTFSGWNTAANGSGTAYAVGSTFTFTADVTLYAQWTLIGCTPGNWIGGTGNWSNAANWSCNTVPASGTAITISAGSPVLDVDFTVANSLVLSGSGGLTIAPNKTLTISGSANFGGRPVTVQSSAAGTGAIGSITGSLSGASNVTVERYIPNSGRKWRLLSIPVASVSPRQAFADGKAPNGSAPAGETGGYGTLITGPYANSAATATGNGFDWWAALNNPAATASIRQYTNTGATGNYNTVPNVTAPAGEQGYLLFVRGDRTVVNGSSATTLRATGQLKTGAQTVAVDVTKSHTVAGNPYAAPIDFQLVYNSNSSLIKEQCWIWDATLGGVGGYRLVKKTGGNWYGIPFNYTGTGTQDNYNRIQSGQAFFVEPAPLASSGNMNIAESHKSIGSAPNVFDAPTGTGFLFANLNQDNGSSQVLTDGAAATFGSGYQQATTDLDDVRKVSNFGENFGIVRDAVQLSLEARPQISDKDTVFFSMSGTTVRNYNLQFKAVNLQAGLTARLEDKFTGKSETIGTNDGDITTYAFSVTSAAGSAAADRFRIVFKADQTLPLTLNSARAYQQGSSAVQVDWKATNERNLRSYEVEKSLDGRSFTKASTVAAKNSSEASYSWLDATAVKGLNYYRIKAISNDGTSSYSQVLLVNIGNEHPGFAVYPNPVKGGVISLQLNAMKKGQYSLSVYNAQGQRVMTRQIEHLGGSATQTLSLDNLAAGVYKLSLGEGLEQSIIVVN